MEEIAAELECSVDTLERRFADVIKTGKKRFAVSVRRQQYRLLTQGNATMGVFLGKNVLGQRDNVDMNHSGDVTNRVIQVELPKKPAPPGKTP